MSNGPFQNPPGAYEMGGAYGLPCEPWLLPISDAPLPMVDTTDTVLTSVRRAARPFQIATGVLATMILGGLLGQITKDRVEAAPVHKTAGQIAKATPSALPVSQASLTVQN